MNAQRQDLGTAHIRINRTGFLGPTDTVFQDTSEWQGSGYPTCPQNDSIAEKLARNRTCWEHWSAPTMLEFLQTQSGPGGFLSGGGADFAGDGPCGLLVVSGNLFADDRQRPAAVDEYIEHMANQTRRANELLPAGAMSHRSMFAFHAFISNGINDSRVFHDSRLLDRDGSQVFGRNCTQPGGPVRVQEALSVLEVPPQ